MSKLYTLGLTHYLLPDGTWTTTPPNTKPINTLTVLAVNHETKTVTLGVSE